MEISTDRYTDKSELTSSLAHCPDITAATLTPVARRDFVQMTDASVLAWIFFTRSLSGENEAKCRSHHAIPYANNF